MKIIGITGGTGCGKTTALKSLEALGGVCIDCDLVYHQLLAENAQMLQEIAASFDGVVVQGSLDRKKLGAIVFHDAQALQKLNRITHAYVRQAVIRQLQAAEAAGAPAAAVDAVALVEGGLAALCDTTVAVTAPQEVRVERLMRREGISEAYARARIAAQKTDAEFAAMCEYVLVNDTQTPEAFAAQCSALFGKILAEKGNTHMEDKFEQMRQTLLYAPKNGYDRIEEQERQEITAYAARYMKFLDAAKTEREAAAYTIAQAELVGYRAFVPGMEVRPGDKLYYNNRGKSVIFAHIGTEPLDKGAHIAAAHTDSPRLDLKVNPLYEDSGMAYFKTHYYGGIKKYQWTTIPLALHGVIAMKDGTVKTISIGEREEDPVFCVTDLLIHLAQDQMKKTLAEGVTGENLNILLGSEPLKGDTGSDRIKLAVLLLLHEQFGISERDFLSAELTMVPAFHAREVGFDRSFIGAYGHDDRVCAYAIFEPMLNLQTPKYTAVCVLADKEEIGSMGVSGMQSHAFESFMEDLCNAQGVALRRCFENSFCMSADVSNAFDPIYAETCDRLNSAKVNYGAGICKYTGSRGKSGSSDASAEVMAYVRRIFDDGKVVWQTSELGKVDQGGGGTVAMFMANRNIDTVDVGVPVLSMHAPMEVVAKFDCYMTMKGMKVFYEAE